MKKHLILGIVVLSFIVSGCTATPSGQETSTQTNNTQESAETTNDEENTQAEDNAIGTRKNPAKINDTVSFTQDSFTYGNAELEISLLGVTRGEEALNYIKNANQFNSDPSEGKEYAVLKFKFTNVKDLGTEDKPVDVNSAQFSFSDASFAVTDQFSFVALGDDDNLTAQLYEGSSKEGSVVFEVTPNEPFYAVYEDEVWFMAE